jgi:hypothetical protein
MLSPILADQKFRSLAKERIQEIADVQLAVSNDMLEAAMIGQQLIPLEFPYASLEVINGIAYVAGTSGVHSLSVRSGLRGLFSSRSPRRYFEHPCFHMSFGWDTIIASAGEKGLFDLFERGDRKQILDSYITRHGWIGASLYAQSPIPGASMFLVYNLDRRLIAKIPETDILGNVEKSWGEYDRICGLKDNVLSTKRARFESLNEAPTLYSIAEVNLGLASPFVSAANSSFGTVIETQSELVVVDSEMQLSRVALEPTNWRLYKNKKYNGFLSVILPDRLLQLVFPDPWFPHETIDTGSIAKARPIGVRRPAA